MSDVVSAVAMRAVLRIVGLNISTCILCVRDMYASLDHHMICCTQGGEEDGLSPTLSKPCQGRPSECHDACMLGRPSVG